MELKVHRSAGVMNLLNHADKKTAIVEREIVSIYLTRATRLNNSGAPAVWSAVIQMLIISRR